MTKQWHSSHGGRNWKREMGERRGEERVMLGGQKDKLSFGFVFWVGVSHL